MGFWKCNIDPANCTDKEELSSCNTSIYTMSAFHGAPMTGPLPRKMGKNPAQIHSLWKRE